MRETPFPGTVEVTFVYTYQPVVDEEHEDGLLEVVVGVGDVPRGAEAESPAPPLLVIRRGGRSRSCSPPPFGCVHRHGVS